MATQLYLLYGLCGGRKEHLPVDILTGVFKSQVYFGMIYITRKCLPFKNVQSDELSPMDTGA